MALLLAPYNNGMRLGQGFNSYTQQICIDDAVVIDPDRADNAVTNDGLKMRQLRFGLGARAGNEDRSTKEGLAATPTTLTDIAESIEKDDATTEAVTGTELAATHPIRPLTGPAPRSSTAKTTACELAQRDSSQIVSYSSRFVNNISEVTREMHISGALSIKQGTIGGAGKGLFVDSNTFIESDLNFFISVKVINQSINVKDALVFQGRPAVDDTNFRSVFGDSFISGFLEGGEFNAIVSIKVIDKDKRMAVKAEFESTMSVAAFSKKANAAVDDNKANFSSQTETAIQVGWYGGGHIKPMGQPWTIQTLMKTAVRFPESVAKTPQRTYAILTKYEALRSFAAWKPALLIPIHYEHAAIYTDALLDAYMDYKNIYRNLGTQLDDLRAGTMVFEPWTGPHVYATSSTVGSITDESRFEATTKGLDLARRVCRSQMMKIVLEVDEIEKDPSLTASDNRADMFQSQIIFRERLPVVKDNQKTSHLKPFGTDVPYPNLLDRTEGDGVTDGEAAMAAAYEVEQPDIGEYQRLAPMVGTENGTFFCNLDSVTSDHSLRAITVNVHKGVVMGLTVRYSNGLLATVGTNSGFGRISVAIQPEAEENFTACSIETGLVKGDKNAEIQVTALRLYTNRGHDLLGNSTNWEPAAPDGTACRDGVDFEGLQLKHFDPLLLNGYIKGFWGYAVSTARIKPESGIFRLAPIWSNKESASSTVGEAVDDTVDPSTIVTESEERVFGGRWKYGWQDTTPGRSATFTHSFTKPLPIIPTVLYGWHNIDVRGRNGPRVSLNMPSISNSGFTLTAESFLQETYNLEATTLVLPNGIIPFQHGFVNASDNPGGRFAKQNAHIRVKFNTPFSAPPKVIVWFTEFSQPVGQRSLKTFVDDVTPDGMIVKIETWANRQFDSAQVAWLAYPADFDGNIVKADNSFFKKGAAVAEKPWHGEKFKSTPKVFTAINYLDFQDGDGVFSVYAKKLEATKDKFKWHASSWGNVPLIMVGICWLAIE